MTYEIRKSMTKMLECLGPAGEHIWRSKLQGCWGMMPGGQGRGQWVHGRRFGWKRPHLE